MIDAKTGSIPYGLDPWHQTSWDARAAGNFVFGGAGSGLIVFTVAAGAGGAMRSALLIAGLALVGLGLLCVSLELGRPFRALNVFINPRTSWMSREAIVAVLLMAVGTAAAFVMPSLGPAAAALAIVFVFCQANIVRAARGIVAWREPLVVPMIVLTGLTEGAAIFVAVSAPTLSSLWPLAAFAALVAARLVVWVAYRQRLAGRIAPQASRALDRTGAWLRYAGTLAPLALAAAIAGVASGAAIVPLGIAAGALGALAGSHLKFTLITRAGFNQGFALVHLPVRGVRRQVE